MINEQREIKDLARDCQIFLMFNIIKDAESDAKQSLASLEQQILLKKKDFEDLQKQFDVYKAKMESLLISQLELIKDINKEQDN